MTDTGGAGVHPIALLVNPAAAAVYPGLIEEAERALGPLGLTAVLTTRERGHAAELAHLAMDAHGALVVVTLGGDGTAAEAAGALLGTGAALAPMPAGSTNVFARALGWPQDCHAAIASLARALAHGPCPEPVTVGRIDADGDVRIFCVNAGAGIDAEAAHTVERHPALKRRIGQGWFGAAVVLAAARSHRATEIEVSVDGGTPFPLASISIACARPYTFLGNRPFDLVPEAGEHGGLGWMGALRAGVTGAAVASAGALTGAWHLDSPRLAHGSASDRLVITCAEGVLLQADGEPLGRHHRVEITPAEGLLVLRGRPPRHGGTDGIGPPVE